MIINKLTLENFGLFSGRQKLDLKPTENKKIVLIGGKNGNGKTTIFEAIRLCLYGPLILENGFSKKEYQRYLAGKIHHNPKLSQQPTKASVGLEFQHAHLGNVNTYNVTRNWENNGKGIIESFEVKRNQKKLNDIDSSQWQDFINDLIPPGLSQLFFFDGEKIQVLADDINDNKQLADSFKSLLGVDLVEKLKSDLEIYTIKQLKQEGAKDLQKKIIKIQDEEKKCEAQLDAKLQDKAQIQSKIDKLFADIERQELLINKEGGLFAQKREELKQKQTQINAEINTNEAQLRELCADILPFIFAKDLSIKLKETLLKEESIRNDNITKKNLDKKIKVINKEITKQSFWQNLTIKDQQINQISKKIIETMNNVLIPTNDATKLIHNLSTKEHDQIISLIERADTDTPRRLDTLTKQNDKLCKLRHKIGKELGFAPTDTAISKEVKKCNDLHHKLGEYQQKIKSKEEEIKQVRYNYEKISRELRKLLDDLKNKDDLSDRLKMINKVQIVLDEYHKELENEKIKEFSNLFIESYNHIARKKNIFEKIEVNTKDYSVTLFKKGNKKVPKTQLSAGEKQIYAIAVLWTLTKISRRPLPFIIDTPLGRLDLEHRDNLIQNFFPDASHQLIILSTDTEVDKKYMNQLKPTTTRTYNLEYEDGSSKISGGYFWT
jgi:DNA sulfur modification protein DndD